MIPTIGFVAPSGTGKTTLLRKLVPVLRERGLRVGYLKHTHHEFQLDTPGKDSYEIGAAGAAQVMLASTSGWALLDHRPAPAADLADADLAAYAARFDAGGLDLLLVEGFHPASYAKIEVYRSASGKEPMYPGDPDIIAVATDTPLSGDDHPPVLPLDDPAAIADFIAERLADGSFPGGDPRDELVACYLRLRGDGVIGNASVRVGERFWITPAGAGGELHRDALIRCRLDDDGAVAGASSDLGLHRAIYRAQPDARAVLHAHGPYSVAVSFAGRDFEPVDHAGLRRLGTVPVLPAAAGDDPDDAAAALAQAMAEFPLCLMAAHGSYAWGAGLEQAARLTEWLELSAKTYVLARQAAAV